MRMPADCRPVGRSPKTMRLIRSGTIRPSREKAAVRTAPLMPMLLCMRTRAVTKRMPPMMPQASVVPLQCRMTVLSGSIRNPIRMQAA